MTDGRVSGFEAAEMLKGRQTPSASLARNVIFALGLATAAEGVFLGGVLPIIPAIAARYHVGPGEAFWVNTVFLLGVGVTCPALSRLGDIYGHKKLTILTLVLSIAGIALDVVAPTYPLFLVGRFLLGFCPAITPLAIGVFRNTLSEVAALYGIGAIAAAMTVGHAVGPLYAGYVFSNTSSIAWVFASWMALMIPSVFFVAALVPESPRPSVRKSMDWWGALTLGIGVAALLFGLSYGPKVGWATPLVAGSFVASLATFALWYFVEQRTASPLVDLRMLGDRRAWPYYVSSFLWGAAYYGSQTTVVLFLVASRAKLGFGFSVTVVGLGWLLLPQNLMNMIGALAVAKIVKSLGGYRVAGIVGGVLLGIGFVGMMLATAVLWQFVLFAMTTGLGSGLLQTTLSGRVSEVCEPHERGISAGMYQTFKNIGGSMAGAFGTAIFSTVVIDGTRIASEAAYMIVFGGCLLASVCIILAIVLDERSSRGQANKAVPIAVSGRAALGNS